MKTIMIILKINWYFSWIYFWYKMEWKNNDLESWEIFHNHCTGPSDINIFSFQF